MHTANINKFIGMTLDELPEGNEGTIEALQESVRQNRKGGCMKTLTLTIAEPWFSMIRDGKKKEEYREIKPYYKSRLQGRFYFKKFEKLVLRNGYRADSPKITLKNPKIRIGTGRTEWGAEPGKQYFVITWEA